MKKSYFDGSIFSYIGLRFLSAILFVFTLGLAFPWTSCMYYSWQARHTVIEGKRLTFLGSPWSLFAHWVKWWILIFLTLGIYSFWVAVKLEEWKVKNTFFATEGF